MSIGQCDPHPEALRFEHVTLEFPGSPRPAIEDVSFRIGRGKVVAVIGPSGCGKSTILNLAARDLIGLYTDRAAEGHARVRRHDVFARETETYFAWVGDPTSDGPFYYRIHSPVTLIEFEHQRGVMFNDDVPLRSHVHSVVRTPNGNDYGVDLLRQHHERFHD